MSFEVGKFYSVPCIKATKDNRLGPGWLPVMGPEHEDAEFIKFPADHWHIDWRFASRHAFKSAAIRGDSRCYAAVVQRWGYGSPIYGMPMVEGDVEPRRMKCKRTWPAYPYRLATWLPKLEAHMADCKLKPGLICPHRGLPLEHAPRDGDVVTCPGHGLRWNVKTGELVPSIVSSKEETK